MDALLARLTQEREQKVSLIKNYASEAERTGRDLSPTELETIGEAKARVASIDTQIAALADDLEMAAETQKRLAKIDPVNLSAGEVHYRDGGAYLYDVIHATDGDEAAATRLGKFRKSLERAGEAHMGVDKDWLNPDDSAGDLKGLYVTPKAALIRPRWEGAPALAAIGVRDLPGYSFEIPYLVDPHLDEDYRQGTGYTTKKNIGGTGATDASGGRVGKVPVPMYPFEVDSEMVHAINYGTAVNVERDRLLAFQPEALTIILDELRLRVARAAEKGAVTELAKSTGAVSVGATPTGPALMAGIVDAAVKVMEATFMPADLIIGGPKGIGELLKAADLAGRSLLPAVGPSNAQGTSNLASFSIPGLGGLRVVMTPAITDKDLWVLNGECIRLHGRSGDLLRTVEAVLRGETFSVAYLMAAVRPTSYVNAAVKVHFG